MTITTYRDGIVTDGDAIVELFKNIDCISRPTVLITKIHKGNKENAINIIKALSDTQIEKLHSKRHCEGCGKLIPIQNKKRRYCEGNKCRQSVFMLKTQLHNTGEWIDKVYHFSHKGQVKGGTITPLRVDSYGENTYAINYLDDEVTVAIVPREELHSITNCIMCKDIGKEHSVCLLTDFKENSKLHIGRVVTIMEYYFYGLQMN